MWKRLCPRLQVMHHELGIKRVTRHRECHASYGRADLMLALMLAFTSFCRAADVCVSTPVVDLNTNQLETVDSHLREMCL